MLLLHDHGARFDIGKEKLIAPMAGSAQREAATAWAERFTDGVFLGDWLAAQGMPFWPWMRWAAPPAPALRATTSKPSPLHLQQLGLSGPA